MNRSETARKAIFSKLSEAFKSPPLPLAENAPLQPAPTVKPFELFMERARLAGAEIRQTSRETLPGSLIAILNEWGATQLVVEATPALQPMIDFLKKGERQVTLFDKSIGQLKTALYAADASISEARWGISETGSLVVWSAPGRPRSISLVPPVHICLLEKSSIHYDLRSLMVAENWAGQMPTNAVLITGASRTADIELRIANGIHGPKKLIIVLMS